MKKYFANFWKFRELLSQLVIRDLKLKYRRTVLGYLWSLLNPLLMMLVISTVFSYFFRFTIENYPIYFLTGQIIFNFFVEATTHSMHSILDGGALIKKVYLPKYIFPVSRTLSSFVNLVFSMLAIGVMLVITRTPIKPTILLFPIPLFYLLLFSLGVSLTLSVVVVYFRDLLHLYGVVLSAWMYFTPIFYPLDILPSYARTLMNFNPLFQIIEYFRSIVLYGQVPSFSSNLYCLAFGLTSVGIGLLIFKKHQDSFVLYI